VACHDIECLSGYKYTAAAQKNTGFLEVFENRVANDFALGWQCAGYLQTNLELIRIF
jgi:hypothetical protein